jgi:N-acetylglucosaminyl-diphospho-decaprenol L-rhamnosyltransferase
MVCSRLCVVIVNYKTPELTKKCISSLVEMRVSSLDDIVVVDNCSGDDSAEIIARDFPGVNLVCAENNGGFGSGINLGFSHVSSSLVLVLNPDTYFIDNSFSHVVDFFDQNPSVGLVGLNLIYPDKSPQFSARRFYTLLDIIGRRTPLGKFRPTRSRMDRHLMKAEWSEGEAFPADWVMGTGFVIRREVFDRIGGMDEGYFLYMEDVDLCRRVWDAGFKVFALPNAILVHDHQRSSSAGPLSWAGRQHLASLWRYMKKFSIPLF